MSVQRSKERVGDCNDDDTYVLCEINISSVYPFPDEALMALAEETLRRLADRRWALQRVQQSVAVPKVKDPRLACLPRLAEDA